MCDLYPNMFEKKYWTLKQALDAVVTHHIMTFRHKTAANAEIARNEHYASVFNKLDDKVYADSDAFVDVLVLDPVYENIEHSGVDYDPSVERLDRSLGRVVPNYERSLISPKTFIAWCIDNDVPRPVEFDNFVNGKVPQDVANNYDVGASPEIDFDCLFPEYKGLKVKDLTDEKFTEIKTSYGLLKTEAEKYNKAVAIAAKIGLLFYEKGLTKPATIAAFKSEYKKHFNGIPQWLIDTIYDVLPDSYKSLAGDNAKKAGAVDDDTIDTIIEASIAAGLICDKEDIANAKDLETKLARYEFEIPPDDYLRAISGACKRVKKQYNKSKT